jgi:hypothetical protein
VRRQAEAILRSDLRVRNGAPVGCRISPLDGCGSGAVEGSEWRELISRGPRVLSWCLVSPQLRPQDAIVEAMLRGWRAQQTARGLREDTVTARERLVRRFGDFTNEYPWVWSPAQVNEWSLWLTSEQHLAPSSIRSYRIKVGCGCSASSCRVGGWRGDVVRSVSSPRRLEPCVRFSRTRLTDVVHRRHSAVPARWLAWEQRRFHTRRSVRGCCWTRIRHTGRTLDDGGAAWR